MENEKISFILSENKTQVLLVAVAVIAAVCIYFFSAEKSFSRQWGDWLEAYTTGVLVFIAVFIWYNEQKEEWQKSLPKRMDVSFLVGDKIIMTCENSGLVYESDVRNWGQQIGKQMGCGEDLKLQWVDVKPVGKVKRNNSIVFLYDLKIRLKSAPARYGLDPVAFDTDRRLHWEYDGNGIVKETFFQN